MTYTKKKIIIEADVPEGATHYEVLINVDGDSCIDWVKQEDDSQFLWDGMHRNWVEVEDIIDSKTNPIEVIE